jgi:hypothetical protein
MQNNTKKEVNLKTFIEEDNCPHCGHSIYGCVDEYNDFQTHFKYNKCDECGETWTERYSLDKVECNNGEIFEYVTSENEDLLARENKAMAEYLGTLGFTQDDITDICSSSSVQHITKSIE